MSRPLSATVRSAVCEDGSADNSNRVGVVDEISDLGDDVTDGYRHDKP